MRNKEELIKIIKSLAKDLDARAEEIVGDLNKGIRKININASIEDGYINEWEITKYCPVMVDEVIQLNNSSTIGGGG